MNDKFLLVEDNDLSAVALGIVEKKFNLTINKAKKQYVVEIIVKNSAAEVFNFLETYSKTRDLKVLGIIVDADTALDSRWRSIIKFCEIERYQFVDLPKSLPNKGLIVTGKNGFRFGAWVMPDNSSNGTVETFCRALINEENNALWKFAKDSALNAKQRFKAPFRDVHSHKAEIITYLAWQDPPLGQMGYALRNNVLDSNLSPAKEFLAWFQELYQL